MMKQIPCTIELTAPVVISAITGGQNHIATKDFIPGTTLLGAVAALLIRKRNLGDSAHRDPWFRDQFLRNGLRFLNAYPMVNGDRTIPLPLSIEKEKAKNGPYRDIFSPSEEDEPHKRKDGYCSIREGIVMRPAKVVNFHTSRSMNPLTGKSAEGEVFTYEALAPDQRFAGFIRGAEAELEILKNELFDVDSVHLGRSKTAQYGTARLRLGEIEDIPIPAIPGKGEPFSLVLVSPVILRDINGFNVVRADKLIEEIEREYEVNLTIVQSPNGRPQVLLKSGLVEQYNRAWRSKIWSEAAISEGSVLRVSHDDNNPEGLVRLLRNGIGSGRGKGFGEVALLRFDARWVRNLKNGSGRNVVSKPKEITAAVKKLFYDVTWEALEEALERKVEVDLEKWNGKNPSKSLVQRVKSMAEQTPDLQTLPDQIREMKTKKAGQNLKIMKVGTQSLYELLTSPPDVTRQDWLARFVGEAYDYCADLLDFLKAHTGESVSDNTDVQIAIIKRYWISFLTQLNMKTVHNGERHYD